MCLGLNLGGCYLDLIKIFGSINSRMVVSALRQRIPKEFLGMRIPVLPAIVDLLYCFIVILVIVKY